MDAKEEMSQWYVQTVPTLTPKQRVDIEREAGIELGEYFPNNAYLVLCSSSKASKVAGAKHVVWVGNRPMSHKIDPAVSEDIIHALQENATISWLKLDVFLFPSVAGDGGEAFRNLEIFLEESKSNSSDAIEIRRASSEKIVLEIPLKETPTL